MGSGDGSDLSGGAKCAKFSLIFFNIIFFLLGIAILAVGIYVLVDPKFNHFKNIANVDVVGVADKSGVNLSYIGYCGIAFCVFGGVMLFISFLGCCGAMKQVRCLLGLYSTVLLVVLLTEIGIGIFAGVYSGKLKDLLAPQLKTNLVNNYMGNSSNKTIASIGWDTIMVNFECCGVYNASDFTEATKWISDDQIPKACCKFLEIDKSSWTNAAVPTNYQDPTCYSNPTLENSNINIGCYDKIKTTINQYSNIVIGVAVGVGLVLLLGVIFGFHLCRRIGEEDYGY